MIESTEFGRSLPRRVASATASRICCAHPDLVGADRHLDLEGRHAGVLADRAFAVDGEVDVLRDDRQRLRRARAGRLGVERRLHRRAHVGRQIGRGPDDELEDAVEEGWQHTGSILSIIEVQWPSAPNAIRSASCRSPPTRTTASRPRARSRTSPSAACARPPTSSPRPSSSRKPPPKPTRALGRLDADVADAIVAAADEILAGALRDQFVVDVYQAGAGTSHNMNANEVLANRAAELLGERARHLRARAPERSRQHGPVDQRRVPDGDAAGAAARRTAPLVDAARELAESFARKADEFADVLKTGRTHLQDAVPMTLGQEFGGYAACIAARRRRRRRARRSSCAS